MENEQWGVFENRHGGILIVSVVPLDDIIEHTVGTEECMCDPKVEHTNKDGIVVTHNSYDGREYSE